MERGLGLEIFCIESIASTHLFLCEQIRRGQITQNCALYALEQSGGVGSRDNVWQSARGNLHLSFCLGEGDLPCDLPLASVSIYFAFLLREILTSLGSKIWLKWPNDLYLSDKKVGGVMSAKLGDFIVGGAGLNLTFAPPKAGLCDVKITPQELVEEFVRRLEGKNLWKNIFNLYVLEFEKSRKFSVHHEGRVLSLREALLYEDGSILLEGKRVYSLR